MKITRFFSIKFDKIMILFLLLIVIIVSLVYFYANKKAEIEGLDKSLEMVISRYNEDLEWLKSPPFNQPNYTVTIYNKGPNDDFYKPENTKETINLPNVGRESHTYLHHIINNYDNLSDIVVFLPGSIDMQTKIGKASSLLNEIENHNSAVFVDIEPHDDLKKEIYDFELKNWKSSKAENSKINPENELTPAPIRPFGKWFETKFGDKIVKVVTHGGIFSVERENILQHPKSYYENLINDFGSSSNPEVGHYYERAWAAIFHPMNNVKIL